MNKPKFRAFNKIKKRMVYFTLKNLYDFDVHNEYPKNLNFLFSLDCSEIMQWTSLKDKNGKEIYEGDIVKFWENKKEVEATIVYHYNGWFMQLRLTQNILSEYKHMAKMRRLVPDDILIIGNHFEKITGDQNETK